MYPVPNSNSEPVQEVGWTDEARVAALLARRAKRKKSGVKDEDVKRKDPADLEGARRAGQSARDARGREDAARRSAANRAGQAAQDRVSKDARHRGRREQDRKKAEAETKKGASKGSEDTAKQAAALTKEVSETKYSITLAKREMASIRAEVNQGGRASRAQMERYAELEKFTAQMQRRISDLQHNLGKLKRKKAA